MQQESKPVALIIFLHKKREKRRRRWKNAEKEVQNDNRKRPSHHRAGLYGREKRAERNRYRPRRGPLNPVPRNQSGLHGGRKRRATVL